MSYDIVSFDILLNGKQIKDSINILSIEVEQNSTNSIARIEVEAKGEIFPIPVNNDFKIDTEIEIKLGYSGKTDRAFNGKITDKGVRLSQGVGTKNIFICEGDNNSATNNVSISDDAVYNIDLGCDANNDVEGGIEIQGSLIYTVGSVVALGNIIEGFPSAPIYSVTHEVSDGNWYTSLHFSNEDKGREKIELTTKKGNKLVLDDETNTITLEDSNGNRVNLSDSGFNIQSPNDITIKAEENILITGNEEVKQEALNGDFTIKGANTKIKADTGATMEGGATATVEGGAQLTLKGAMVMIN